LEPRDCGASYVSLFCRPSQFLKDNIFVQRLFAPQSVLANQSRVGWRTPTASGISVLDLALLMGCGLLAAATVAFLDLDLRVPGNAILRGVLPLSLGMALVPRRGAGLVMGGSALAGLGVFALLGRGPGMGASTSLVLTGPLLDLAAARARSGWRLYVAFGLAGLGANLGAFLVRGGGKAVSLGGGGRLLSDWLTVAPLTYAACGLAAGLISAAVFFRTTARPQRGEEPE
jgi:hypothetical protein